MSTRFYIPGIEMAVSQPRYNLLTELRSSGSDDLTEEQMGQVITSTFNRIRHSGECLYNYYDQLDMVEGTAHQAMAIEAIDTDSGLLDIFAGINMAGASCELMCAAMIAGGTSETVVNRYFRGRIILSLEAIISMIREFGVRRNVQNVERLVAFLLGHERQHSNHSVDALLHDARLQRDTSGMMTLDSIGAYNTSATEYDADRAGYELAMSL